MKNIHVWFKCWLIIYIAIYLVFVPNLVLAQENEDVVHQLESEIEELQRKINEAKTKEKTLISEIESMDSKIQLMVLQVAETEEKISLLGEEIAELTNKIDRLELTLSRLSEILLNRIVASYKANRISYLTLFFSSSGITDLLNKAKYVQVAQAHDRQVMVEVQTTKDEYGEQKDLREIKKQQQEELRQQLVVQKEELADQKAAKEALLAQTKNDEAEYQRLLQQALAERRALETALITGVKEGPVKQGDPIALVGNSGYPGCSTGPHLHFEIQKNGSWTDPGEYLKPREIEDGQNGGRTTIGRGDWEWPLEGDIILTQHYGHTPYSWRYSYSGGVHTGLDMYSFSSEVIRAPKDGTLYSSSSACGSSSIINIKYIEHGDGIVSFYLHVK